MAIVPVWKTGKDKQQEGNSLAGPLPAVSAAGEGETGLSMHHRTRHQPGIQKSFTQLGSDRANSTQRFLESGFTDPQIASAARRRSRQRLRIPYASSEFFPTLENHQPTRSEQSCEAAPPGSRWASHFVLPSPHVSETAARPRERDRRAKSPARTRPASSSSPNRPRGRSTGFQKFCLRVIHNGPVVKLVLRSALAVLQQCSLLWPQKSTKNHKKPISCSCDFRASLRPFSRGRTCLTLIPITE